MTATSKANPAACWQEDHLTNIVYTAGYRGLAFYGNADQALMVIDEGESPFDVDQVTMTAWIMPYVTWQFFLELAPSPSL